MRIQRAIATDRQRLGHQALMIAAVFYLALVQILSVAHAASGEGMAPDHDASTCVLHISGDRSHAPVPASAIVVAEPLPATFAAPRAAARMPAATRVVLPPSRGPPSP